MFMSSRCARPNILEITHADQDDELKLRHKIWAGAECGKLGTGRRSGVPALVVLESKTGGEMAFLAAESKGAGALGGWPLDDDGCVW